LKVRVVDINFSDRTKEWWSKADEILDLDLRDYKNVAFAVNGADIVFHLAADMGGVGYFTSHDYYPFFNNMRMSLNVLEACEEMKVKKLFFSSSACIYPTHTQMDANRVPLLNEKDIFPANSDQMYGWEKLMTLMLCQRSPVDTRVGIFHTIFGEGQEIEGDRVKFPPAVVSKAIESKKSGKSMKIWGDGRQLRTFLYIEDALNLVWNLVNMPKEDYKGPVNISSPEIVSVEQVALMMCEIAGIPLQLEFEKDKPSGSIARGADLTKLKSYFNYEFKYTVREGFERMYEWMKTQI
jgi:nucleoside-diphosphate-sugar epimerase